MIHLHKKSIHCWKDTQADVSVQAKPLSKQQNRNLQNCRQCWMFFDSKSISILSQNPGSNDLKCTRKRSCLVLSSSALLHWLHSLQGPDGTSGIKESCRLMCIRLNSWNRSSKSTTASSVGKLSAQHWIKCH